MDNGRFQNIINSEKPILVDFYTDWCAPCKQVGPIMKEIKDEFKEAVRIIKVNVDKNPFIATQYNVRNVPTIMLFKNREVIWTGLGVIPFFEIKKVLLGYL